MVVRPDNDVERALKAFGDLSLKYRSFGAIPLRIGGAPLSDNRGQSSLEGMSFDPMGTDAPTTAAETYSLLGSALGEARDVRVAPRRAAAASGYVAPPSWSTAAAPPPAPPSLTDQALGNVGGAPAGEPDRWQAYSVPPMEALAAVSPEPEAFAPPPAPRAIVPSAAEPFAYPAPDPATVFERPAYVEPVAAAARWEEPVEALPTIFGRMRVAPPPPRSIPETVFVPEAEPAAALIVAPIDPIDVPVDVEEPLLPAQFDAPDQFGSFEPEVAPEREPDPGLSVLGLTRRAAPPPRQPLAGLFRSLAQPVTSRSDPVSPDAEPHTL